MFAEEKKRLVYVGSDHAGFGAKNILVAYLREKKDLDLTDLGCFTEKPCDYPDIAREVGEKVFEHKDSVGILFCGSGIGVTMAANKVKGVRAVLAMNEKMAEMARRHNNANVLSLAGKEADPEMIKKITDKFLTTDFEKDEERHVRRVEKLNTM